MRPIKARIRKWVEALESGEYYQVHVALRDSKKGRCCLGVACDVFRKETGRGRWYRGSFEVEGGSDDIVLPIIVANWFGFNRTNPNLRCNRVPAITMNDKERADFREIAKAIRETYIK